MNVTDAALRNMLLELALGSSHDSGEEGRAGKDEKEAPANRSKTASPITPSLESSVQLSSQLPNIADEKYVPENQIELSKSLYAIGSLVKQDHIEKFYSSVKDLYTKITGETIA